MPDQPPTSPNQPLTRAERRRHSEQRILAAARGLFAERGYDRTTIRAVAAAAEVDPALVMQHFGSKDNLFRRASRVTGEAAVAGDPEQLVALLLSTLGVKLAGLPETSLAMMRSMLTHPEAAETARATLDRQIDEIAAAVPGDDARERAALAITTMLGVTLGRQLLELDALRDVPADRLVTLLGPTFEALLGPAES